MKIITEMGVVWRFTNKAYRQLLKDRINGVWNDARHYGKEVGNIDADITDMKSQDAQWKLEYMDEHHER